MFKTILIANRGEIACRVIKTARRMGIRTVAVYSEADRDALHVEMADDAVLIGPPAAAESYLLIDRIVEACKKTGAQAVHPGYGFLSEREAFPRALQENGIVFIGPNPGAIAAMGDKIESKKAAAKAKVSTVPGFLGVIEDDKHAVRIADEIGYPVMIKASAGGGGKGMRIAHSTAEVAEGFNLAKAEAKASFGDDRVFIEKFIVDPRHIEIQVLGDKHGNVIYLGERECSIQRRNQKVIEEAPSPTLSPAQRETVCAAARRAAGAVNYVGAGTIEFVSDGRDVFFIEMNTRLQVEHPVTELITGVDLVEWQLRVAFGEPLPLTQDQIKLNGHAIEARVYAENPAKNFMPSVGTIKTWRLPAETGGLRIDAGYREGDAVSPYYDAMLAKMIAWAPTRDVAIERLNRGLEDTDVRGIVSNIPFLSALLTHPDVAANAIDTGFIERHLERLTEAGAAAGDVELCAAVAAILIDEQKAASHEVGSPWRAQGWMPVGLRERVFSFRQSGSSDPRTVTLTYGPGVQTLSIDGRVTAFSAIPTEDGGFDLVRDGVKSHVVAVIEGHELYLRSRNGRFDLHWIDPFGGDDEEQAGEDKIVAPLPGTVVALLAQEGAVLEKGAAILTLEVMKMEQTLRAPFAGVLKAIKCKVGDIVQEGVELAEVEPSA